MKLVDVKKAIQEINEECVNIPNISLREAKDNEVYAVLLSVKKVDKEHNKIELITCEKNVETKEDAFKDHGDITKGLNTNDIVEFSKTSGPYCENNNNKDNVFRSQIKDNIYIDVFVNGPIQSVTTTIMVLIKITVMNNENKPEIELLKSLFINPQNPNDVGSQIFDIINGKLIMDQVAVYSYSKEGDEDIRILESVYPKMINCDCGHEHH